MVVAIVAIAVASVVVVAVAVLVVVTVTVNGVTGYVAMIAVGDTVIVVSVVRPDSCSRHLVGQMVVGVCMVTVKVVVTNIVPGVNVVVLVQVSVRTMVYCTNGGVALDGWA